MKVKAAGRHEIAVGYWWNSHFLLLLLVAFLPFVSPDSPPISCLSSSFYFAYASHLSSLSCAGDRVHNASHVSNVEQVPTPTSGLALALFSLPYTDLYIQ